MATAAIYDFEKVMPFCEYETARFCWPSSTTEFSKYFCCASTTLRQTFDTFNQTVSTFTNIDEYGHRIPSGDPGSSTVPTAVSHSQAGYIVEWMVSHGERGTLKWSDISPTEFLKITCKERYDGSN